MGIRSHTGWAFGLLQPDPTRSYRILKARIATSCESLGKTDRAQVCLIACSDRRIDDGLKDADNHPLRSPYRTHRNASTHSLNPSPPPPPHKTSRLPSNPPTIDFDEGVLRTLCGLECGFPLVIDRLKQAVGTSREVGLFLKKKSQLEEEYGIKLAKLAKERLDAYTHLGAEVKAGSFARHYCNFLATHERMAIERTEYGARLNLIADEITNLGKEVERVRKANKDVGWRLEKNLAESEGLTEKAKAKFDVTVDELERVLMSRQAENPSGSGGSISAAISANSSSSSQPKMQAKAIGKAFSKLASKGTRSATNLARLEDEVLATQQVRQEYFNLQLPRILRNIQMRPIWPFNIIWQITLPYRNRYLSTRPYESTPSINVETDNAGGSSTSLPCGLKDIVQSIDNRADFKEYMANYAAYFNQTHHAQLTSQAAVSSSQPSVLPHASTPSQTPAISSSGPPGSLTLNQQQQQQQQSMKVAGQQFGESPRTSIGSNALTIENKKTFGVDLATQMIRDGIETVPKVVEKCIEAIEKAGGIDMVGIYRLSGTTSKIGRLKQRFDTDIDNVKLEVADENQSEINDIAGAMKLWFRELPEPLLTWNLYASFIEAGRFEHIRLHERVNELPDANYATLKYLMGHLDKFSRFSFTIVHLVNYGKRQILTDVGFLHNLLFFWEKINKYHRIRRNESINSMGASNLAVIFGPTLLSPPPINFYHHQHHQLAAIESSHNNNGNKTNNLSSSISHNGINTGMSAGNNALQDMSVQCKVVETILEHYREIFVDEGEEENEEDLTCGTGGTGDIGLVDLPSSLGGLGEEMRSRTGTSSSSNQNHSGHVRQLSEDPPSAEPSTVHTQTTNEARLSQPVGPDGLAGRGAVNHVIHHTRSGSERSIHNHPISK
ncbi:hypothetical protein VP01_969g4 [Puccinia sorghi]|uniref:Rho-GAP domain-containing protein n=1 Tax=Puccinia sorghi TaxID=27349 RepID=A0A0L6U600_9BASI|nr:hypothetical protein VP01_969g4 [Puccinia sorghi]